jgi:hypothetical protein
MSSATIAAASAERLLYRFVTGFDAVRNRYDA